MKTVVRSPQRRAFTLVEIVLALMVAAVGCIGVMALFPVGLSKNKETVAMRSAADAADQFLHTLAADIRADWYVTEALPDDTPTMSEDGIVWSEDTMLPDSNCTINFSAVNASDDFNPLEHQDGVFKVIQKTPANFTDFTGVIRAWKELTEIGDPRLNGDIVPVGILDRSGGDNTVSYGFEFGKEYVLKDRGGDGDTGNYGPLALGGNGASIYESNWNTGFSDISVGDIVPTQTGNMAGPTVRGVNTRLENSPYVQVPVITEPGTGHSDVTVLAFLPFKLVSSSSSGTGGNASAQVRVIYIGNDEELGRNADGRATSYKLALKAEVSWPLELDYELRQKKVYSLQMFKGGLLASFTGAESGEVGGDDGDTGGDDGDTGGDDGDTGGGDDGDTGGDDGDTGGGDGDDEDENTAPVAEYADYECARSTSGAHGVDATVDITLVATDADGDDLTWSHTTPDTGTLSGTAPNLVFTGPVSNYTSTTFTFTVNDGNGGTSTAAITISKP